MKFFNTLQDVYSWLDSIPMFGNVGVAAADFSLDSISEFCEMMGNPQNQFPSIHVAGTNGKGTTCQMLASVYQSAGYKTGLYTSPHLLDYRDRFKIDASSISESDLVLFFQTFEDELLKKELTYFELSTAIAFWHFNHQSVDIAIIETGLGGRLDATKIINPLVSVITSVGLDHTDILGDTIEQIAAEKAGIIKPNTPVVMGNLSSEAELVVATVAEKQNSDIVTFNELDPQFSSNEIILETVDGTLKIDANNRSKIDTVNCAMAYQAVKLIKKQFPIENNMFKKGIEMMSVRFPIHAHFERLERSMDWYFDGGHNSQSISIMIKELQEKAPLDQWTLVLSVMKDKLNPEIVSLLQGFKSVYVYPQKSARGATVNQMKEFFPDAAELGAEEHLPKDWLEKHKSELVIFGGSF
ncbi:MAG: Mur ligase family protein, partial [Balneolaceae bacterium]